MTTGISSRAARMPAEDLDKALALPAVPPPFHGTVAVPVIPVPRKLIPGTTKKASAERAAFLRACYLHAVDAFYPAAGPDSTRPGWFRNKTAKKVVEVAARALLDEDVAPSAYCGWIMTRAREAGRKSPPAPAWVLDPGILAEHLPLFKRGLAHMPFARARVLYEPWLKQLDQCTDWVHREIRALPRYDEPGILRIVQTVYPDGWAGEYEHARKYCAQKQAELDAAVQAGKYIWEVPCCNRK